MPAVTIDSRNSKTTVRRERGSWGMILLGVLLLLLSLLMFLFVLFYFPRQKGINSNKRIERIPPVAWTEVSKPLPSPTPTQTNGGKNDNRNTVSRQHASHGFRRRVAAQTSTGQDSLTQSPLRPENRARH